MNDAPYTLTCELCGREHEGGKTETFIECDCGKKYAVTITLFGSDITGGGVLE